MFLVGTSGWSYDDWVGPVYPEELRERKGEWLSHHALRFPTVEINSTFYRIPPSATVKGWIRKTARLPRFEFSVKAPQELTHDAMVKGDEAKAREVLARFQEVVLAPLAAAERLGAVLLQLSPHFRGGSEEVGQLGGALDALRGFEAAVEFRHRTWLEGGGLQPETMELLASHAAALCAVDGPSFPPMLRSTAPHAYVRFHGRRSDVWFAKGEARRTEEGLPARYDYLYTRQELEPWARVLRENESRFRTIRVYFNNHPGGKAVKNAEEMVGMLGVEREARPSPPQRGAQRSLAEF